MLKTTGRKLSLIIIIICIFIFLPSCQKPAVLESETSTSSGQGEKSSTTTTTTQSEIAPSQTAEPTPPNGETLFDENLYAVLPGEGPHYNIFDCYGRQIDSFSPYYEGISPFYGLFTELGLSLFYRFNQSEVQLKIPENIEQRDSLLYSYPNGFYQINHADHQVILYSVLGKHVQTIPFPSGSDHEYDYVSVDCFGDETIVSLQSKNFDQPIYSSSIYFVALDGTVNNIYEASALPGRPIELLGRKYFLVDQGSEDYMRSNIYDFSGNIILKDVYPVQETRDNLDIYISDYYIQNNKIYDGTLQLVAKDQLAPDGELICGLEYTVDEITCVADRWTRAPANIDEAQPVAVGVANGRMAVKTSQNQYSFACQGDSFFGMNEHFICVTDADGKSFQLISTKTGEALDSLQPAVDIQVADEYIIIWNGNFNQETWQYDSACTYIIDKEGKRHDVIGTASATYGDFIVLSRGPYLGIADLDGNWVIKGLNSSRVTGE